MAAGKVPRGEGDVGHQAEIKQGRRWDKHEKSACLAGDVWVKPGNQCAISGAWACRGVGRVASGPSLDAVNP